MQPSFLDCSSLPENVRDDERLEIETRNRDSVVTWTDGAPGFNEDARFRRAGCGVFFGLGEHRNRSFTPAGREQTNNRAELLAVIPAMRVYTGNLEIRTESEYVVRIAAGILRGGVRKSSDCDADLWNEFETEVRLNSMATP